MRIWLLVALLLIPAAVGQWTMEGGDETNARSDGGSPGGSGEWRWHHNVAAEPGSSGGAEGAPVPGSFIVAREGHVARLNLDDGGIVWSQNVSLAERHDQIVGAVLHSDGLAYVSQYTFSPGAFGDDSDAQTRLLAFDSASGKKMSQAILHERPIGITMSENHILIQTWSDDVIALAKETMNITWHADVGSWPILPMPPVVSDGSIVIAAADGVHAISDEDGQSRWHYPTLYPIRCRVAIADGTVYAADILGGLHGINLATGIGEKIQQLGGDCSGSGLAYGAGVLWVTVQTQVEGCPQNQGAPRLLAIDSTTGTAKTSTTGPCGHRWHAPTIAGSTGFIAPRHAAPHDWSLTSFDTETGEQLWRMALASQTSSPPIYTQGTLMALGTFSGDAYPSLGGNLYFQGTQWIAIDAGIGQPERPIPFVEIEQVTTKDGGEYLLTDSSTRTKYPLAGWHAKLVSPSGAVRTFQSDIGGAAARFAPTETGAHNLTWTSIDEQGHTATLTTTFAVDAAKPIPVAGPALILVSLLALHCARRP